MSSHAYEPVRKLAGSDAVESFDCGQSALNQFLQRFALVNQKSNSAQTYGSCHSGSVAGFYSLAVGSVEPSNAAPRVTKGIPQDAKDETARKWCLNWEFEPSPSDPFHLFLLMRDIKAGV